MKNKERKGFTLVELLAVIVILGIIMIIAIPAVLTTMQTVERRSFVTYVDRIGGLSSQRFMKDNIEGKASGCYIYNIKDDFDLSNTGSFKGYVLVNSNSTEIKYYITLWNDDYMLVAYNYTDGINYKGQKITIEESLEKYDASRTDELTPNYLCNYACNTCTYEGASDDPYNNTGETSLEGDITKIKGATTLIKGRDFKTALTTVAGSLDNIHEFKRATELKDDVTKELVSGNDESSINNPVYIWFEDNTIYFYSDATKIFLNPESSYMFLGLKNVTDLSSIIKEVETNKVTDMSNMFDSSGITKIDLSNWNTSNVIYMFYMFANCSSLEQINVSNWNVSKVTNMSGMFRNCTSLGEIDVLNWNTSNLRSMEVMFYNCLSLRKIDVSNWNTSNVTNMGHAFAQCHTMTSLDVSKWDTSNVTTMRSMFYEMINLKSIDVSKWNTSKVTDMGYMFNSCNSLTSLDVSNFDVSNVKDINYMFWHTGNIKVLDLTNWHLKQGVEAQSIFNYMAELETIYVSESWKDKIVLPQNDGVFYNDKKLVGGNGTKFISSYDHGKNKAVIDGENGQPGYFTKKA